MRKLKKLKKILEILEEYTTEVKTEIEKVKKEHQKIVLESSSKIISEIAKGENLDEVTLLEKYLHKKSKKEKVIDIKESSEELLSHVTIDGEDYFYEDRVNGSVYDSESNKVGILKCGNINMFTLDN
jgi:hypothetical protein